MSITNSDLDRVKEAVSSGRATKESFLIGTESGKMDALKRALAPVFQAHGGQIKHEFTSVNTVLAALSDEGLEAAAALPETAFICPNYKVEPC